MKYSKAEFDRLETENKELKVANACGTGVYEDMCDIIYALQSHLDKISEATKPSPRFVGARVAAADLRQQGWGSLPEILEAIADYLDSQKASEKVNHVHSDDSGIFWEGREEDCSICNPPKEVVTRCDDCGAAANIRSQSASTSAQCPECIWGQKIVYLNGYIVPVYVGERWDKQDWVYERCPRCKGRGTV